MKSISKAKGRGFMNWLCVSGICFILGGCSSPMRNDEETSNEIVRNSIKTVPHVQEIRRMFPNAPMVNFFNTQYGIEKGKPVTWQTLVFFGGRYRLAYQVEALVDSKKNKIGKIVSKPKFDLWQVSRVYDATPDNIGAEFSGDYKFGETDWEKVVAAKGDFSVIGIQIVTNSPVPRFDEYVHGDIGDRAVEP